MLRTLSIVSSVLLVSVATASEPIADASLVFAEKDGLVAVEAEHYFRQTETDVRAFYLTHSELVPTIKPDGDESHVGGASRGAYLEILPDTRRNHGHKLIHGENFMPQPGRMAVVSYKVHVNSPGRYYVWVRAHSTGSEDNGLHVGIDGQWPSSGQRLQWCEGKHTWRWDSRQRTEKQHCGEPGKIYLAIDEPGEHVISFSMREDGFEFDKWLMTTDRNFKRPSDSGPSSVIKSGAVPTAFKLVAAPKPRPKNQPQPTADPAFDRQTSPTKAVSDLPLQQPRKPDGDGSVRITGERKTWHKITLNLAGPYAHEKDNAPNPFTDQRFQVDFTHADGTRYSIPGYFAADGDAANSSAEDGTTWKAHFAPDRIGRWSWKVSFTSGENEALNTAASGKELQPFHGQHGTFEVTKTDKSGRDMRAHGRLQYVGERYLRFAGTGRYFLKAGADAPETLLGYKDFDNTEARKKNVPLKTFSSHVSDWKPGDPSWRTDRGKGLIGAVNYLSGKGCNAFSFLTYNAGGDGDNVWPFIHRDDKLHYDCSKLDQWGIVFDHGTAKGMYLHFKMQETENDDHNRHKGNRGVPECLDGGNLGRQRKLYCRELIARFGHNLALNWNLGEENTQSTKQQTAMIDYIAKVDAYDHNIVIHTFPNQQDKVYKALLGSKSGLTGTSLQNSSLETTHAQTVKWIRASEEAGKPWVVAFDESGSAAHAQCPDLGYNGFDGHDKDGKMAHTQHKVRKQTLWGTLMAGGAGNEYYFGYKFDQNDLVCEDWRSRDQSWDYCRIAINFFHDNNIPFWEMSNADELVGNPDHAPKEFCFRKPGDVYLVYLPNGGEHSINLTETKAQFTVSWFNPRAGGSLEMGTVKSVAGGGKASLGLAPADQSNDWLAVLRRQ